MRVLVTGANGFVASHLIPHLIERGFDVVGVDDDSKYGERQPFAHEAYTHVRGSVLDESLLSGLMDGADYVVANAAAVGGLPYLTVNDGSVGLYNSGLTAATLGAAIRYHERTRGLKRYVAVSSSIVFAEAKTWPTPEGLESKLPPPHLSYGMEKRAMETYVRAAGHHYGLPYTIVRPFNCVGTGETRAVRGFSRESGSVKLVMGHVIPDLIHKVLLGQAPLHILGDGQQRRHFTAAEDIARGIAMAMTTEKGRGEDFNLSIEQSHSIIEVAEMIWRRMRPDVGFDVVFDPAIDGDVAQRSPSVSKAADLLNFRAEKQLSEVLDDLVPWVSNQFMEGRL
ncbi:NAD-dependent epimerase/dehydratase family protein [Promicromonospora kroppenstedtii]|uniref:NAD-dependent epimerase/dehydratase family protein n=1 Tax=Promicromonospora kroppenstedtii TaxID=440482 RepID=UPI00146FAE44|nr:NAD(P)-dependent oxidoreductase [Promicromonospora kroppenstedtii]